LNYPFLEMLGLTQYLPNADKAYVETALTDIAAQTGLDPDKISRHPHAAQKLAVRAIARLSQENRHAETVAIGQVFLDDLRLHPGGLRKVLLAAQALGKPDVTLKLLDRLAEFPDLPEDLSDLIQKLRQRNLPREQVFSLEAYHQNWGAVPPDLDRALASLPCDQKGQKFLDLARGLYRLGSRNGLDFRTFRMKLAWGAALHAYTRFLLRTADILTKKQDKTSLTSDETRLVQLATELENRITDCDLSPVLAQSAKGRSIMIVQAHAGFGAVLSSILLPRHQAEIGLPETRVASNQKTGHTRKGVELFGTTGDIQSDFLKLVKQLRREQRVIRILPDGPDGEQAQYDLLGGRISLGLGAEMLAWHAKAAVFFLGTRWQNGRITAYLRQGPCIDQAKPREDFDAAFQAFYLKCLEEIVLSGSENIGSSGRIWHELAASLDNKVKQNA